MGDGQESNINKTEIINDAYEYINEQLDDKLDEYNYSWPKDYRIKYYTISSIYWDDYEAEVERYKELHNTVLKPFDLVYSISNYWDKTPYKGFNIALGTADNFLNPEPGVSDIGLYSNRVYKARRKAEYIDTTDYRYMVYDGKARNKFIQKLNDFRTEIEQRNFILYETDYEKEVYKNSMLNRIDKIINMNVNYEEFGKPWLDELKNLNY